MPQRQFHSSAFRAARPHSQKEEAVPRDQDHYRILSLQNRRASPDEIKKAFRSAAKKYHPDVAGSTLGREVAQRKFNQVNTAHEVLSDPQRRREYDIAMGYIMSNWETDEGYYVLETDPADDAKRALRKLKKTLREIERLEANHANGVKLSENQLSKIRRKVDVLDQIREFGSS
mmetsp:Transcript_39935/g.78511  ORF Transcript_39935/g.78511 Transcript_39935/m.78511 type:complete len:174 (+) Transcript_39935:4243-4764(+)